MSEKTKYKIQERYVRKERLLLPTIAHQESYFNFSKTDTIYKRNNKIHKMLDKMPMVKNAPIYYNIITAIDTIY